MRNLLAICAAVFALVGSAAAEPLMGDGAGCKDKALGIELASLKDTDARYISIWAQGSRINPAEVSAWVRGDRRRAR